MTISSCGKVIDEYYALMVLSRIPEVSDEARAASGAEVIIAEVESCRSRSSHEAPLRRVDEPLSLLRWEIARAVSMTARCDVATARSKGTASLHFGQSKSCLGSVRLEVCEDVAMRALRMAIVQSVTATACNSQRGRDEDDKEEPCFSKLFFES